MLTCCREDSSNNTTESYKKLPEWHVFLSHCHHKRTEVVLHKYPRDPMAACSMVDDSLLKAGKRQRNCFSNGHLGNKRLIITDFELLVQWRSVLAFLAPLFCNLRTQYSTSFLKSEIQIILDVLSTKIHPSKDQMLWDSTTFFLSILFLLF